MRWFKQISSRAITADLNRDALSGNVACFTQHHAEVIISELALLDKPDFRKNILPDNPLFYLRFVGRNQQLKADLKHICLQKGDKVTLAAQRLRAADWQHPVFKEPACRDYLFLAYAANLIPYSLFHTSIRFFNLDEQFSGNPIRYKGKDEKGVKVIEATFPGFKAGLQTLSFFSPEVSIYRNHLAKRFDISLHTLEDAVNSFKLSEQTVFVVSIPAEIADKVYHSILSYPAKGYYFWNKPMIRGAVLHQPGCKNDLLFWPSYSLVKYLLEHISPKGSKPLYPVLYLGNINNDTIQSIHENGYQPCAAFDTRISSNYIYPHGELAGPLWSEAHDEFYHAFTSAKIPYQHRNFFNNYLWRVFEKWMAPILTDPENKESLDFFNTALAKFKGLACDLDFVAYPENMVPTEAHVVSSWIDKLLRDVCFGGETTRERFYACLMEDNQGIMVTYGFNLAVLKNPEPANKEKSTVSSALKRSHTFQFESYN